MPTCLEEARCSSLRIATPQSSEYGEAGIAGVPGITISGVPGQTPIGGDPEMTEPASPQILSSP
jgi:hypothetical protein